MIRTLLATLVLAAMQSLAALAQVPAPTPTPNLMQYDDPGMHFVAPAKFLPAGQRPVAALKLSDDPVVVAGWVLPDRDRPRAIVLQQEAFEGPVEGFDQVYEQQLRSQFNAFFHEKEHFALKNGMPAMFLTATWGEGFQAQKAFIEIWSDGVRGVALVLTTSVGDIDSKTAKAYLADCTAVRYPIGREQ